jgi:hypothetical protein
MREWVVGSTVHVAHYCDQQAKVIRKELLVTQKQELLLGNVQWEIAQTKRCQRNRTFTRDVTVLKYSESALWKRRHL